MTICFWGLCIRTVEEVAECVGKDEVEACVLYVIYFWYEWNEALSELELAVANKYKSTPAHT